MFGFANYESEGGEFVSLDNTSQHPILEHPQTLEALKLSIRASAFIHDSKEFGEPLLYLNKDMHDLTNTEDIASDKIFSYCTG